MVGVVVAIQLNDDCSPIDVMDVVLPQMVVLWKGLVLLWMSGGGGGEFLSSGCPVGVVVSQKPDYTEA